MAKKQPGRATGEFRTYMASEIQMLLAEVESVCSKASPHFNDVAIAWIEKNAVRFRKQWERCCCDRKKNSRDDVLIETRIARNGHGA